MKNKISVVGTAVAFAITDLNPFTLYVNGTNGCNTVYQCGAVSSG